jgi:hypothetical protein
MRLQMRLICILGLFMGLQLTAGTTTSTSTSAIQSNMWSEDGIEEQVRTRKRPEEVVVEAAAAVEVVVVEVAAGVAEGVAVFISGVGGSAGVVRRDEDSVKVVAATRKDGKWLVLVSGKGYYFTDTNTISNTHQVKFATISASTPYLSPTSSSPPGFGVYNNGTHTCVTYHPYTSSLHFTVLPAPENVAGGGGGIYVIYGRSQGLLKDLLVQCMEGGVR